MSNESYRERMTFKKAAKRDISAFDSLKGEKYYDAFHRPFKGHDTRTIRCLRSQLQAKEGKPS